MSFRIERNQSIPWGELSPHSAGSAQRSGGMAPNFDQVEFSRHLSGMERRVRELTGQLSQQVLARPTSGEIAALREQVDQGTYRPDASEIAARMLLLQEV